MLWHWQSTLSPRRLRAIRNLTLCPFDARRIILLIYLDNYRNIKFIGFIARRCGLATHWETDYARWKIEDRKLHFSIGAHGDTDRLDHLGIELETSERVTVALEDHRQGGLDVFGETHIVYGSHETDKG